jgi:hypothetical protein
MATEKERQELRSEVEGLLKELSAIHATSLGRRHELSPDINFEEVVPDFQIMLDVVRQLNDRDLSRIPHQELNKIKNGLDHLKRQIQQVHEFTLMQENPGNTQKAICDQVKNIYDSAVQPLMITLAFTATQATDYAKLEREAQGFHTRLKEEFEAFKKTLAEQRREAEEALVAIKEQAAEAGVSAYAQNYSTQADEHNRASVKWFWATIITTAITFVVAIIGVVVAFVYTPSGVPEAIQYTVAKVIVLSVLSFAILWCARNYRSEKHNETLNRHRANSLGTFRTFVAGTQDSATKNAILLFCAQAAFAHQPSGYDTHEGRENPPQIVNPVVELLGKATPTH